MMFFYTGIAITNVTDVLVDCQHNDWGWDIWYISSTNVANNYAAVTTPLQPPNEPFPPNLSTPGGRDFAATWTDNKGRRWLFGGNGFPYPSPLGKQASVLSERSLGSTIVRLEAGSRPISPFLRTARASLPSFRYRVDPLEEEDVPVTTLGARSRLEVGQLELDQQLPAIFTCLAARESTPMDKNVAQRRMEVHSRGFG